MNAAGPKHRGGLAHDYSLKADRARRLSGGPLPDGGLEPAPHRRRTERGHPGRGRLGRPPDGRAPPLPGAGLPAGPGDEPGVNAARSAYLTTTAKAWRELNALPRARER